MSVLKPQRLRLAGSLRSRAPPTSPCSRLARPSMISPKQHDVGAKADLAGLTHDARASRAGPNPAPLQAQQFPGSPDRVPASAVRPVEAGGHRSSSLPSCWSLPFLFPISGHGHHPLGRVWTATKLSTRQAPSRLSRCGMWPFLCVRLRDSLGVHGRVGTVHDARIFPHEAITHGLHHDLWPVVVQIWS